MSDPWIGTTDYAACCRPKLADLLETLRLHVDYVRARGSWLHRLDQDGCEVPVLDLVGGFGAGLLGHNHPELKATLAAALNDDVPFLAQCSGRPEAGRLARRLGRLLPGDQRYICNFSNSGAEAVEAGLKHAYKVRLDVIRRSFDAVAREVERFYQQFRSDCPGLPLPGDAADLSRFRDDVDEYNLSELERFQKEPVVLALKGSFHGKTTAALKVTFNRSYREGYEGLAAIRSVFIDPAELEQLPALVASHAVTFRVPVLREGRVVIETRAQTSVIALCLEIIQGEGGIRPLPDTALRLLAELHGRLGVPYLVDEIQTGCGRTGTFFACGTGPLRGIQPEYVLLGKALGGGLVKVAATLIREDIYDQDFAILHTSTWAEDGPGCLVASTVLDLLERDEGRLMREVSRKGDILIGKLRMLQRKFPGVVAEVRGRGLMIGIEFTDMSGKSPLFRFGARQGFLSLLVASYLLHHHRIRVLAPLTTLLKGNPGRRRSSVLRIQPDAGIGEADIDRVIAALDEVFTIIARNHEGLLVSHLVGASFTEAERLDPPAAAARSATGQRRLDFDARVGFILHPANVRQVLRHYFPTLAGRVDERRFAAWWSRLARFLEPDVVHTDHITSGGYVVQLNIVAVPFLPQALASTYEAARATGATRFDRLRLEEVRDRIQDAVTIARELGDERVPTSIVGLGAYTSIVTDQGRTINDFEVPITTGNAYTAGLMLQGISAAAAMRGLNLADAAIAVVGAGGNIGSVLACLLAARSGRLRLVGRDSPQGMERLEAVRQECLLRRPARHRLMLAADASTPGNVSIHSSVDAVRDCDIVLIATNSPEAQLITPDLVREGAIVSCASVPSNLASSFREQRHGCLVFDGGYARLPEAQAIDFDGLPTDGLAYGCLSETLLLGFDGRDHSFARGPITPAQVEETIAMAEIYGFTLGDFHLDNRPCAAAMPRHPRTSMQRRIS
jgi:acetylornithine/succinyldiaminopimelate/putrescine aminotransferase/predicted amino acid dehydrogenase